MEDHEPSDLIPLFNGMVLSFINYELQVRIESKTPEEISQAKCEHYPMASVRVASNDEVSVAPSQKETPKPQHYEEEKDLPKKES